MVSWWFMEASINYDIVLDLKLWTCLTQTHQRNYYNFHVDLGHNTLYLVVVHETNVWNLKLMGNHVPSMRPCPNSDQNWIILHKKTWQNDVKMDNILVYNGTLDGYGTLIPSSFKVVFPIGEKSGFFLRASQYDCILGYSFFSINFY